MWNRKYWLCLCFPQESQSELFHHIMWHILIYFLINIPDYYKDDWRVGLGTENVSQTILNFCFNVFTLSIWKYKQMSLCPF